MKSARKCVGAGSLVPLTMAVALVTAAIARGVAARMTSSAERPSECDSPPVRADRLNGHDRSARCIAATGVVATGIIAAAAAIAGGPPVIVHHGDGQHRW